MDITQELASSTDAALAELWSAASAIRSRMEAVKFNLAHCAGVKPVYETKTRRVVRETAAELIALVEAKIANPDTPSYEIRRYEENIAKYAALKDALAANAEEAAPLEALYSEHRWSRFFLVTNSNGHIHSSMNCSTCRMTTEFAWLPAQSGLTEKDAVDAHGPHLCTACFPSAPVEWTVGTQKDTSNECPGSRTYDKVEGTFRQTSYTGSGNAKCSHCEQNVGITTSGKIRAHKKEQS